MNTGAAVSLQGLEKHYGGVRALDGLDLEVQTGEVFGLVGVNGAGKTTTLSVIMGFVRATAGAALVLGRDPWTQAAELHREVGWLPGEVRLPENTTARDWLEYGARVAGLETGGLRPLAEEWELPLERPLRTLSKGNRQKVALVRLLLGQPRLLVLDEPTSGLDPVGQERLIAALYERARRGATVLFSSHSLVEVEGLCDRAALIHEGRSLEAGPVADLVGRGPRRLHVWTREPIRLEPDALPGLVLINPRQATLEGTAPLETALPHLLPFGVERLEYGGEGLEGRLARLHGQRVEGAS